MKKRKQTKEVRMISKEEMISRDLLIWIIKVRRQLQRDLDLFYRKLRRTTRRW